MQTTPNDIFDITIIGAGPVGLYAAFYAGLRTMRVKIVDSLGVIGGQLTTLYPKKLIYDVAGYPKVIAEDLVTSLYAQAAQYNPVLLTDCKIETLKRTGDFFTLGAENGTEHFSKTVLIAAGVGAFMPRKLDNHDAVRLEHHGLYYAVKDPKVFHGKRLLVVGGGDSAMDWVMALANHADITQIHRRDKFTAHEDSIEKVKNLPVKILTFHEIKQIIGEDKVEKVVIFDNRTNEEKELTVDAILCNLGFLTNLGPIKDWGVDIFNNAVKVDINMETTLEGIYAAGDIVWHPAKLKLIATGFGEAAIAVNNARIYTDPNANFFPGHSSNTNEKKQKEKVH